MSKQQGYELALKAIRDKVTGWLNNPKVGPVTVMLEIEGLCVRAVGRASEFPDEHPQNVRSETDRLQFLPIHVMDSIGNHAEDGGLPNE